MNITESVILITGGAKGIGNFLAKRLAEIAEKVIVIDNDQESLKKIEQSSNIRPYYCDLTDHLEVNKTISEIYKKEGIVNVLINNAGLIHSEPLFNMIKKDDPKHSIENWQRTININLNAVFYTTVNVVEKMRQNRIKSGLIINISSISALGNMGQSAYSATKAAVESLSTTWSKELGMFKIRSVAIAPGFFDTESTRNSLTENILTKWEQAVPLKRLGHLEELYLSVKFSIENDYFNGKVISIDGGLTI
jgi:3-oxoacyl-[acyl-carrier protein] reductase